MKLKVVHLLFSFVFLICSNLVFAQTELQREKVINETKVENLTVLQEKFNKKFLEEKAYALKLAKEKGWEIEGEKDGRYYELIKLDKDGKPIYYTTFNANAAVATRANTLHNGGILGLNIEGQDMTAHIWDAGLARSTHQEYDGIGGDDRYLIGDGTTDLHFHAAHVAGTIMASGFKPEAKGMAPQADAYGYDWNNDIAEATTAAAQGMLVSNHSYGWRANSINDWVFGAYVADSRNWDEVMYNAPYYLMLVAAGNDGNDNVSNGNPLDGNTSYDKLSGHACSKNNLVVANARNIAIDAQGNYVSMEINLSSSEGPTDDYRIKPDISGSGTGIYSTVETSNSAYNSLTGTSMATPNVTGTLLLLQQHYYSIYTEYMRAATLKGLALHTADDAGLEGPDPIFGWGLMNAKKATETINNRFVNSEIQELVLANGQSHTMDVFAEGSEDLIVSISWTDLPGTANQGTANLTTPVLVNDLDVRVMDGANTNYPYKLTSLTTNTLGDNVVDPYEKIIISNPVPGQRYTIQISHKGTLDGDQAYSLIVTGISNNAPNTFTANSTTPNSIDLSWNKNINNDDVLLAYNLDGNFGDPINQQAYQAGDMIPGGGEVIYAGNAEAFDHNGLTENTQYFYKIWSKMATNDFSAGRYVNCKTIKSEPTNYPTNFIAGPAVDVVIPLAWNDAVGAVLPDGYIIKASEIDFNSIIPPVDGISESDTRYIKHANYGDENIVFDSLTGETTYFFKIYPYTNSGTNINYKTDGNAPQASTQTQADPCAGLTLPYSENFDSGDNCWNGITGHDSWLNITPTTPAGDHTGGGTCFVTNGNFEYNPNSTYKLISPTVSLYGFENCELTFWIYMNAELSSGGDYWDGGYVECFDGTNWVKVTTSLPYDGVLSSGNSLGATEGWSPETVRDWTQVTVDLSAYDENPDFRFRVMFGSDGASGAAGWAVDDIEIVGDATCIPPEDQASNFMASNITYNSMDIAWSRGIPNGGDNVLVVAKEEGSTHADPEKGVAYLADASFGAGSEIGTGNFVVYNGPGTSVSLTNLTNITEYTFSIYEYNSADNCYHLIELTGIASTLPKPVPTNHATQFTTGVPQPTEIPLTWVDVNTGIIPDGYLILANTTGIFVHPTNTVPVADDTDLSDGSGAVNVAAGQEAYTFINLNFNTQYHFRLYPYTNHGNLIAYKTDGIVPECNESTLIDPCSIYINNLPYSQNFDVAELPQCWENNDLEGSGMVWDFGTIGGVIFGNGNYAYLDSDGYGLNKHQDADLVTHTFDFSTYEDVTLSFDHYYRHVGSSSATLSYSIDNGATWTQLEQWTSTTSNPVNYNEVINILDGESEVKFKFNYVGNYSWYWCIDNILVSGTQSCTPPSTQASNFAAANETENSIDISWTRGNGDKVLILAREESAVNVIPENGTNYTADADFGNGDLIGDANYVVYNGDADNVTINGLSGAKTYHFAIYEYAEVTNCYLTPGLTGTGSTTAKAEPTNHVTNFSAICPGGDQIDLSWTNAIGGVIPDGYLILANTTGIFVDPVDLTEVANDTDMSDGAGAINIIDGSENYSFTSLNYGTQYFFKIYPYSNSGALIDYKVDNNPPTTNATTASDPCIVDLTAGSYSENFDALVVPNIPNCASVENTNSDSYTWETSSSYSKSGPNSLYIRYNTTEEMDDWFFSAPLELEAGKSYDVNFWYRARSGSYPESLELHLGTANNSLAMTEGELFDADDFTNTDFVSATVNFTVPFDGVYYLGWHGYSTKNMYQIYLDDIVVTEIANPNNAPVVDNAIADMVETEGFASTTVDLTNVFSDPDGDALTLSASSDNGAVVTASVVGTTLTISEIGLGTANITVTANDGTDSTDDVFSFTVNAAPNNAPVVDNAIADMVETEGFASTTVDLTNVFSDPDGDALTLSASSDNGAVVTASVVGTTLTISEIGLGTANITVTANDGTDSTDDVFSFTVNAAPNNAPVVDNAIADMVETEGFASTTVDLTNVFSDPDGDALTLSASSDNGAVVTASVVGTTLTISEIGLGTANITVTATDGTDSTDDVFSFTVNAAPNNAPVVDNAIADMVETEGFASTTVDLTNVFSDPDGDALTLSASSGDMTVVSVAISGTTLTIIEVGLGNTQITVTANDGNGGSTNDVFNFTINAAPNNAPVVDNPCSDITEIEGFISTTVSLYGVFSDPDGDALALSATIDDESIATVSLTGTLLTITEIGLGTANITITANDGNGGTVSDVFMITINEAPNNTPQVINPLDDMTEIVGFGSITVDLTNVFSDPDGDALMLSATSNDESVVTVSITGTTLTITEVGIGNSDITVIADDGEDFVGDLFIFTVQDDIAIENESELQIEIYPNPVETNVNIKFENNASLEYEIEIFGSNGQIVYTEKIKDGYMKDSISIDVTEWKAGTYIIRISNEKINTVKRFVVK